MIWEFLPPDINGPDREAASSMVAFTARGGNTSYRQNVGQRLAFRH
ncbi:glutamate synthase domain-containing protein 3 [Rhodococcus sp. LBL1]|nr:glutamate synthase domain-containing protein 3 [Rhodococcus sp. LBL1]MDH6685023.1 glutamate synthase domain-containing protein 3 [Rhodococcus sp. LBL2]